MSAPKSDRDNKVASAPVQGGEKAKFKDDDGDFKLAYTKKQELSKEERKAIKEFEERVGVVPREWATLIDEKGNAVYLREGNEGSVLVDFQGHPEANIMSHIHPRPENERQGMRYLGGSFSTGDIECFTDIYVTQSHHRAAAVEGTYWISRNENMTLDDRRKLLTAFKRTQTKLKKQCLERIREIDKQKTSEEISLEEYKIKRSAAFNRWQIEKHNWLLDHQTAYNYSYGLERRPKK